MQRRDFVVLLAATVAWPVAALAQPSERIRRVGILVGSAESDPNIQAWIAEVQNGLAALGWRNGHNVHFERRFAGGDVDRTEHHAQELVRLDLDVIVTSSTPAALVLLRKTRSIPVVFTNVTDPVGSGVVRNLARPGGNITGFTNFESSIGGKWLEILKDISPSIKRASIMTNLAVATYSHDYIQSFEAAATSLSVQASVAPVNNVAEIDAAIAAQAREPGGSVIVIPDIFIVANRLAIIASSARHRVPVIYPYRVMANDGGLVVYGPDIADLYRRAATYVDRILKGEKPGDLPVQQPTKFELVINLKTAKALGLAVPPTLLALADEVIE